MNKHSNPHAGINAVSEIKKIRAERSLKRRQGRRHRSKLEPHRSELVSMHEAGANYEELAYWLAHKKKLKVHPTSIMRYLKSLPELEFKNA